jgi:hypothetical protein
MDDADHRAPIQGSAYGLTIRSHVDLRHLLLPPAPGCPELTIEHRRDDAPPDADHLDATHALITRLDGRRLTVERASGRATLFGPIPNAEELAHPLIGAAAIVISRWLRLEVFHAGSFSLQGKALCVVGANQAGKSTLLSAIAARGLPIMADDLAFTDGHWLYAGPRTLDLRAARNVSAPLRPVRNDRLRMTLDPAPSRLPLGGWLLIEWAPRLSLEPIAASELLQALIDRRSLRTLPSDPETFLALAGLPAWRLRRPSDWSQLEDSIDLLLAGIGAKSAAHRELR